MSKKKITLKDHASPFIPDNKKAKSVKVFKSKTKDTDFDLYIDVFEHYKAWTEDVKIRMTRKHGWNEITDVYWGKLPEDWPFISRTVDPRIRTSLIEKNARLLNANLRGRLSPRRGGTVLGARINNSLIDFQWDNAKHGGTMHNKLSICDQDARLYCSKFALSEWTVDEDPETKELLFEGNELYPLDIRDCGMDFAATHIRDAKWFQLRSWEFIEDLENSGKFKNLDIIKAEIGKRKRPIRANSRRRNQYVSRIKQLKGLQDRVGTDSAFPMLMTVTEYREDKWITFAPEYQKNLGKENSIIRVIDNPYEHHKIPVSQLRYYPLQDDALGESEVEPVISLWLAIQAVLCSYLDEVILKMRPPLKVIEGAAKVETIVYGPEAQWLVSRPDAITEMQSNSEAIRYFQTTYSALVSAFNTAMGDASQGIGGIDPFNPEKTATEIKHTAKQQNTRDQKNQTDLADFIKDIVSMWLVNNRQFLFRDPEKKEHILSIVGSEEFNYFKRSGLDEMEIPNEAMMMISDIIQQQGGNMSDDDINNLIDAAKQPRYPIYENPEEKDLNKIKVKPKMTLSDLEDGAELSIVPKDLDGNYDYIPDIKSMSISAGQELAEARAKAIETFLNPQVVQMLLSEGQRPKVKDLIIADLEEGGLRDSERFFETVGEGEVNQTANQSPGGVNANQQVAGLPGLSAPNTQTPIQQQMA